jgi:hypothetical protein
MLLHPDHRIPVAQSREIHTRTSRVIPDSTALRVDGRCGTEGQVGLRRQCDRKIRMPPEQIRVPPARRRTTAVVASRRGEASPRRGSQRVNPRVAQAPRLEVESPGRGTAARFVPRYTAFVIVSALAIVFAISNRSVSRLWAFIEFGSGVFALLLLTFSVLWGVAAADRFLLDPNHRLIAQAIHRGAAVGGIGFLGLHIWSKIALGSTSWQAAAIPGLDKAQPILVGMGTVAGYLFIAVTATGAVRGAFARKGQSRLWRALHMTAYLAWGASLVHGLRAGRGVSDYVDWGYALALTGVTVVLMMRLAPGRSASQSDKRKKEK